MKPDILVIDDEECIRYTFEAILKENGYNVTVASDYEEALKKISHENFDIIFSDILLGGDTGIDLLRKIKERKLICPVIMITGYPNIETAGEAIRLGAFDYIPKPVNQDTLLKVSKMALEHKKIIDEREKYRTNMEAIFRSVKEGIITVDRDLNITAANKAAEVICGIKKENIGKKFNCNLNSSGKQECIEGLTRTVEEKKYIEINRIEGVLPNSKKKIVSVSITPLITPRGEASGAVMVIRDETKLASLEETLKEKQAFHNIVGKSWIMQNIYNLLDELADLPTTVLITGESGTGKELIADALHNKGQRKDRPFVKVNCSALPENLLESELFGHVKGAFTGAIKDKTGRFEVAHRGTIFLDEIGDISPALQLRLLRVLQEKEFEKVGDIKPKKVDVRIIAATNQSLLEKVKKGEFRNDLYYRLKVVEIKLPPLRDKREDIPLLVEHFIKKFNKEFNKNIIDISRDVKKIFLDYTWPGNIRELEHAIEHSFVLCRQSIINPDDLPVELKNFKSNTPSKSNQKDMKDEILKALKKTDWNKSKAARLLGISRRTIYRKIEEYKIYKEE